MGIRDSAHGAGGRLRGRTSGTGAHAPFRPARGPGQRHPLAPGARGERDVPGGLAPPLSRAVARITAATVRADFNDLPAVLHYARAAHGLGLWASERQLIERFFPRRESHLLEAGCGAGRVTLGLWALGYRRITAFDFAVELLDQARSLAAERGAGGNCFLEGGGPRLGPGPSRRGCSVMVELGGVREVRRGGVVWTRG